MRDLSICLAPDGTFHMVWTTSWHDDIIGYASSPDLIVYFDRYMKRDYGAELSRDHGDTWEDVSSQIEMPEEMCHGTAIRVSRKVVDKLKSAWQ